MNFAGNNIAIICAESLGIRLYAIGLQLYTIPIQLLQKMVGDEISS